MAKEKSTNKTVGVRLEKEYRDALTAEVAERGANVSVSDVIRDYIIKALREDACRASLFECLELILHELREARRDHALMAEVLLTAAGKCEGDYARKWAKQNIKAD